jgi:putative transposase
MKAEVYGISGFHQQVSELVSRTTKLTTHGGDRKSENHIDQVA